MNFIPYHAGDFRLGFGALMASKSAFILLSGSIIPSLIDARPGAPFRNGNFWFSGTISGIFQHALG